MFKIEHNTGLSDFDVSRLVLMDALKTCPKFAGFWSRIYNLPGNVYPFSKLVATIAGGLSMASSHEAKVSGSYAAASAMTSMLASIYDFPFWVIPPRMHKVIMEVDPPSQWDMKSISFGFPSMYFILPRGSLTGDGGENIACVSACMMDAEGREALASKMNAHVYSKDSEIKIGSFIVTAFAECGTMWHLSTPVPMDGIVTQEEVAKIPIHNSVESSNPMWAAEVLLPYVSTILAIMSARPDICESDNRKIKTIKKSGREVWSHRILGDKYSRNLFRGAGDGSGTGGSVAVHWRRGHLRNQRHGPKLSMVKQVLIDPVLVGLKDHEPEPKNK